MRPSERAALPDRRPRRILSTASITLEVASKRVWIFTGGVRRSDLPSVMRKTDSACSARKALTRPQRSGLRMKVEMLSPFLSNGMAHWMVVLSRHLRSGLG